MKPGTVPVTDRRLSSLARYVIPPKGIRSTGWPRVRDTCHRLGWRFDEWQDGFGRLILSKKSDGLYAADAVVMSIPRQVGKTYLVACLIFALCLIFPRLTVIWTAHRTKTADETFETFDGMSQRSTVAPHIRQVTRGKSDKAIRFRNGSRILFGARENGFGRGFTDVDILVFDEAQILGEATLEDMGASQNVAKNPLTFFMGTPPRPKDPGEAFTSLRQEALDGDDETTLYVEFSADRGTDPMDVEQLRKCNPSYPHRTTHRAMLRLRKLLKNDDSWNREARGIWDEINLQGPVWSAARWKAMRSAGPPNGTKPKALGVDMSHDRGISVSACWLDAEQLERAHGEEVWAGEDADTAVAWIAKRAGRRMPVVVDAQSPAAELAPQLRARGCRVIVTSAADMAKACGSLLGKTKAKRWTHADQQAVNDAVRDARRRPIGTAGGWGWDRRDETSYIPPIVSMTLALFGALATTKPPSTSGRGRRASTGRSATS